MSNGKVLQYTYSNNKGEFILSITEKYKLPLLVKVASIFFKEQTAEITTNTPKKMVFTLLPKEYELDEVVVVSSKINRDTVNLGIKKYHLNKNESIEKSLKKIPGITVTKEGKIKYFNKEIKKILIDGDDLADNQYTFISKNLKTDVIDDIQVLKNFEENTVYKKIKKSDEIALNLKIKKSYKNILFGNVVFGYGNNNHHKESTNIGLLRKEIKFLNFFKNATLGTKSIGDFLSTNDATPTNSIYHVAPINTPLPTTLTDFNKSLSNTFLVNKKFKNIVFRSTNFIGFDNQTQKSLRKTTYFSQQANTITEEKNYSEKKNLFFGEGEIKHTGLKKSFIVNKFAYKVATNKLSSVTTINQNNTDKITDANKNNLFLFSNKFQHTTFLNKKMILNNQLDLSWSKLNENTAINTNYLDFLSINNNTVNQQTNMHASIFSASTDINYLNKKFKSKLLLNYKNNTSYFKTFIIPNNTNYTNDTLFKRRTFVTEASFIYKLTRKTKVKGRISNSFFRLNSIKKTLLNYSISLDARFLGNLKISYAKNQIAPNNDTFIKNYYLTSSNTLKKGVGFFNTYDFELFQIKLHNGNYSKTFDNEVVFNYKKANSFFLEAYSFLNNINYIKNEYINAKNENFIFKEQFLLLLNAIDLGLNFKTTHSFSSIPLSSQNTLFNKLYNGLYKFEITSYFSGAINFNLSYDYSHFTQKNRSNTFSFNTKKLLTEIKWDINKETSFNLEGGFYEFDSKIFNPFNIDISYTPKKSNFSYHLRINNLLNEKQFSSEYKNAFFFSKETILLVPFYVFGSIKYIF